MAATNDLGARLYDNGSGVQFPFQFWSEAELVAYITEALRTWNALTSFWKTEFLITPLAGNFWYDIPSQPGSPRAYNVVDNNILTQMEFHLLEPTTSTYPLNWTGSNQFSIFDLLGAIQRRRDEVLSTSGCTVTRTLLAAAIQIRTLLPDIMIDIRRLAWLPAPGFGFRPTALRSSDDWAEQSFDFSYTTTSGPPSTFRQSSQPPLSFDVDAIPPCPGQYEVMSVNAGGALSTTSATLMGMPDDWTWVVKWGALSDVLGRESLAKDAMRADYCEKRYREGMALLTDYPAILAARLNNLPLGIDAVRNGDDFDPGWQNVLPSGQPTVAYVAGLNMIGWSATAVPPSSATWSLVENAPVPSTPTSPIQLGRDDYDAVLDYAQHLAAFKQGGEEFSRTMGLYQKFLKQAALYNSKLNALGVFARPMYEISQLQAERNPVYSELTPEKVAQS